MSMLARSRDDADKPIVTAADELKPFAGLWRVTFAGSPAAAAYLALKADGYRWPKGEPHAAGFSFCGATRADPDNPKRPYCAAHERIAAGGAPVGQRFRERWGR